MKRYILLLTIHLLIIPAIVAQEQVDEQIVIPLTNPGQRGQLSTAQINGNITVTSYDGKEVIVKATTGTEYKRQCDDCDDDVKVKVKTRTTPDSPAPPGMKRIETNSLELRASEENNVVEIETESWKQRIHLDIRVPENFDVKLNTVHGEISVTGIKGALDVSSVNGGIRLENVSGSVITNTVNGEIKASILNASSGEPMSFVTLNGNVDVTLPSGIKTTVKMKSDRGEIYSDFEMVIEKAKPEVKKSSGEYEVSINSWVYGKINGGGPEYTFKNMNGNIIVRKGN